MRFTDPWSAFLNVFTERRPRYYGGDGTIHATRHLDVEVCDGRVVAVWFRCQMLPFRQRDVESQRAAEMTGVDDPCDLIGVEVLDPGRC